MMFTKLMYATFTLACTTFFIGPFFDLEHRRLPLFDHIPFLPYDKTPYYEINYVYQLWTFAVGTVICKLNYAQSRGARLEFLARHHSGNNF